MAVLKKMTLCLAPARHESSGPCQLSSIN